MKSYIKEFHTIGLSDTAQTGIKSALLGELYNQAGYRGLRIPYGFAVTMAAYDCFIASNALENTLAQLMAGLDRETFTNLETKGAKARRLIMTAKFPPMLESAIIEAYNKVSASLEQEVAVRSSLDFDYDSKAYPMYETYLNIKGNFALLYAIKCCFASLYSDKAIEFRERNARGHHNISMAVAVQQMVRSDLACSGTGVAQDKAIKISGVWGLGTHAAPAAIPDEYIVNLLPDGPVLLNKKKGDKCEMLVYNQPAAGINTTNLKITPPELRDKFTLDDTEAIELAKLTRIVQDYFHKPMIVEWAKDGIENNLHITGVKAMAG